MPEAERDEAHKPAIKIDDEESEWRDTAKAGDDVYSQ